ncbi:flagellar basal-body rod protein FlgG [Lachnotalea glycerini]|uniref:Flagellar basal-body rod protein FlgG n=1 Tax=Lachnotalea glycerini TaxID=1763509 RepID=A0A255IKV5_9FIRM|nr:flagellar basal-body rod protein FlgG [Lachnotalea glycerini]OYP03940.1 flagellar basal-body rod protein FlgG [Lachnotalea glycerini]PXV90175.1 flagellar basal-body rod protein FlgG [Lachnotalea glycerini]RDY31765.1 flagellar basal-body rod protein FlgG [Lachnotalea glycerini]
MVRTLWTAASGMIAQQTAVDTIANNLANVNTTGYKNETAEFKSLLYQTLQTKTTSKNGENKPIGAQVGLGVRNSSITSHYTQGTLTETGIYTNFAVSGNGFFAVKAEDGKTYYTRNGVFQFTAGTNGLVLATSEGYPVLDTSGNQITIPTTYNSSNVTVNSSGQLYYTNADGTTTALGKTIGMYQFNNPAGLLKQSDSLYAVSDASGAAINESTNTAVTKSKIYQGYLEASNVQVADEMVNLIVAQRAYEMNSKAVQAADDMMQQANNLR